MPQETVSDYGVLAELVKGAAALMSATGAIIFLVKRRARWEPSEQDVDRGAQRAAAVLVAVGITLIWYWLRDPSQARLVTNLALLLVAALLVFLVLYSFVVGVFTYEVVRQSGPNKVKTEKVAGGLWLTRSARKIRNERNLTTQALLKGLAYDLDAVWPKASRQFVKLCFLLGYIGLISSATLALTCAAILLAG